MADPRRIVLLRSAISAVVQPGVARFGTNRAEHKPGPVPPASYGHPGAWKAFSKAGFCCPPWLTDVG
jgi:hypothetical protein